MKLPQSDKNLFCKMKSFMLIVIVNCLALFDGGQIQHYSPYGINWNEASLSCGSNGLEISEEDLKSSDVLENQEFWIGKTPIFTPWVELLGCYEVHGLNETEFYPFNTRSECQKKCHHVKHFGFKKTSSRSCICIPYELLIDNRKNMSACKESDSYYVYKEFPWKVVDSDDPGNCMTLCCGGCTQSNMFEGRNCNAIDFSTVARCATEVGRYVSTLFLKSTVLSARNSQSMKKTKDTTNTVMTTSGLMRTTDLAITKVIKSTTKKEKRLDKYRHACCEKQYKQCYC